EGSGGGAARAAHLPLLLAALQPGPERHRGSLRGHQTQRPPRAPVQHLRDVGGGDHHRLHSRRGSPPPEMCNPSGASSLAASVSGTCVNVFASSHVSTEPRGWKSMVVFVQPEATPV